MDFIFLSSWYDVIKAYDDDGQSDMANAIAKEIITYGVTGDTTTTNPLIYGLVRGICSGKINRPKARVGNKGGRPPKYDRNQMLKLRNDGLSEQDIADNLGCSVKTVQRALAEDEI